ncbi:hypothetical protein RFI_08822, partial [Reticulomyxa filosa]
QEDEMSQQIRQEVMNQMAANPTTQQDDVKASGTTTTMTTTTATTTTTTTNRETVDDDSGDEADEESDESNGKDQALHSKKNSRISREKAGMIGLLQTGKDEPMSEHDTTSLIDLVGSAGEMDEEQLILQQEISAMKSQLVNLTTAVDTHTVKETQKMAQEIRVDLMVSQEIAVHRMQANEKQKHSFFPQGYSKVVYGKDRMSQYPFSNTPRNSDPPGKQHSRLSSNTSQHEYVHDDDDHDDAESDLELKPEQWETEKTTESGLKSKQKQKQ